MSVTFGKVEEYIKKLDTQKLKKLGIERVGNISVKEMGRGGYNINYLADIGGKKFVFRFNLDKYLDVANQTEYEYDILKHLEKTGIATKAYFIDTSRKFFEYDLLVEEFIENKAVQFGNEFLNNFGKLIKKLHSVSLPKSGLLILNSKPLSDQLKLIKSKVDFIKSGNFNKDFLDFINPYILKADDYAAKYSGLFKSGDICINHRDLVLENVLQTDSGLKLIDWQSPMADDPSYDLAFFTSDTVGEWSLGRPFTDGEKKLFLESYGADKKLLEKIRIRQPLFYLEIFVWVAFRAAYLRNKFKKNLVKDIDKEFFQKRIAVYESFLNKDRIKEYLISLK